MLDWLDVPYPFEKLASILGTEFVAPNSPKSKLEVYQYTYNLALMMAYIPLGLILIIVIRKEIVRNKINKRSD